jgi:hypothetical protein
LSPISHAVTVTISLPSRTFQAGQPVRGRLIFDNRSGHPFRNDDACRNERMAVALVGHDIHFSLSHRLCADHPYLLPTGTTAVDFTVATTETDPSGLTHPIPPGRYRLETWAFEPSRLQSPPTLRIQITAAATAQPR